MRVLQRNVDVLRYFRQCRHSLDHFVGEAVWIEVEDADPVQAIDFVQLAKEFRKGELLIKVVAVLSHILGNQVYFSRSHPSQVTSLSQNSLDRLAVVLAAKTRDGAEGALVVAPFADLQVGTPRLSAAGASLDVRPSVMRWRKVNNPFLRGQSRLDDFVKSAHLSDSDVRVSSRSKAHQLGAHPLGQAAGDDDFAGQSGFFVANCLLDGFDGLLLGRFEESAGVDDGDVGML